MTGTMVLIKQLPITNLGQEVLKRLLSYKYFIYFTPLSLGFSSDKQIVRKSPVIVISIHVDS